LPKKKAIDDAVILEAHKRLGNGRAVSRETGVHENTVYQVLRRAAGACLRCGGKPVPGKASCQPCLDYEKARVKQERARRLRAGVCVQCEGPRSPLSSLYCEKHRIAAAAASKARKKALRGSPQGEAQSFRQKMRSLLARFGQAGRDRWNHAGGACEICATPYGEAAIHLHHIDRDRTHNTFENLICLCHDCHTAGHALLRLKQRAALLVWVERAYPLS
jgi:hypothetical protein